MRAAILTVSSSKAAGEGDDESGDALARFVEGIEGSLADREIVADDPGRIEEVLRRWCRLRVDLILTTGGTGFAPDDVTPEATRAVIEREAPGIAEAMRLAAREHTRHWMLSRGVAGIAGRTLLVNFPGSPASIEECGAAIADALPHALALLAGEHSSHA